MNKSFFTNRRKGSINNIKEEILSKERVKIFFIWVEAPVSNIQGLSEEAINALVLEVDSCMTILANWDAWAVWSCSLGDSHSRSRSNNRGGRSCNRCRSTTWAYSSFLNMSQHLSDVWLFLHNEYNDVDLYLRVLVFPWIAAMTTVMSSISATTSNYHSRTLNTRRHTRRRIASYRNTKNSR